MSRQAQITDPVQVAQFITEARMTSREKAAEKFGVSKRTADRIVARHADNEEVQELVQANLDRLNDGWLERTMAARDTILVRLVELVGTSKNLREVCGALKIVHDANLSERVVGGGLSNECASSTKPTEANPSFETGATRVLQ